MSTGISPTPPISPITQSTRDPKDPASIQRGLTVSTPWLQFFNRIVEFLGTVVDVAGALEGDGTAFNPLKVRVDGVTVVINGANNLQSIFGGVTVAAAGALSGDGTGGNPLAVRVDNTSIEIDGSNNLSLKATAVTPGTYGDATHVPAITVDADGRIVAASDVLITATSSRQFWQYKAKTSATSGYPGDGYLLWNNATQTSATNLLFSHLTDDNLDIDLFLSFLAAGSTIILQDADASGNFQEWLITGATTNTNGGTATSYWTVPVSLTASGGTGTTGFANNHRLVVAIFTPDPAAAAAAAAEAVQITRNTGDGATVDFSLPDIANYLLMVAVNGVVMDPAADYTLSADGTTVTFTAAPGAGQVIVITYVILIT